MSGIDYDNGKSADNLTYNPIWARLRLKVWSLETGLCGDNASHPYLLLAEDRMEGAIQEGFPDLANQTNLIFKEDMRDGISQIRSVWS